MQDVAFDLYRFCEWSGKNPNELLQINPNELLRKFTIYEGYTLSVRRRILINVRSFYKHNDQRLTSTADVEYTKVKEYHKITKADLYKIWRMCYNPRDRFLLSLFFSRRLSANSDFR